MYLPLAAVAAAAVLGGYLLGKRLFAGRPALVRLSACAAVAAAIAALAVRTVLRNADYRSAVSLWEETAARWPLNARVHNNLGLALAGCGRIDEAIVHFRKALDIDPEYAKAQNNLGNASGRGQIDEAIVHFRKALEFAPDFSMAHNNLGMILAGRGEVDEGIAQVQQALEIKPDDVVVCRNLEVARSNREKILRRLAQRRESLRACPNDANLNDTAWLLATNANASVRNGPEAVELAHSRDRAFRRQAAGDSRDAGRGLRRVRAVCRRGANGAEGPRPCRATDESTPG